MRSYPKSPIWIPLNLPTSHQLYLDDVVRILTRSLQAGGTRKKTPVNCTLIKDRRICTRRWGLVVPYARVWLFRGGIFAVQKAKRTAIYCRNYWWYNESPFQIHFGKTPGPYFLYSVKVHLKESMHNTCSLALDQSKTNSC